MKFIAVFLTLFLVLSCTNGNTKKPKNITYSTTSPDAIINYDKGWEEIMDKGEYGAAELSYRKALENDPDFLIGKSVLARLTLDLNERLEIYSDLQKNIEKVKGDERLLLDVYTAFVFLTNQREQFPQQSKNNLDSVLKLAEKNLKYIVHSYPKEIYLKAEYIEILHSIYGPEKALDSLNNLTSKIQKDNPFLLGYAAVMHAELNQNQIALEKANLLKRIINDSTLPKSYAVFADVYLHMDSLEIAKEYAKKANALDKRNLDASRLLTRINEKLLNNSKI